MSEVGVVRRWRSRAEAEVLCGIRIKWIEAGQRSAASEAWLLERCCNSSAGAWWPRSVAGPMVPVELVRPRARERVVISMGIAHLWLSREVGVGSKCIADSMRGHWSAC